MSMKPQQKADYGISNTKKTREFSSPASAEVYSADSYKMTGHHDLLCMILC